MSYQVQNSVVIVIAGIAIWGLLLTQTNCFSRVNSSAVPRERCYGLALATANLCATSQEACSQAIKMPPDASSWLYLPQGKCAELGGKVGAP